MKKFLVLLLCAFAVWTFASRRTGGSPTTPQELERVVQKANGAKILLVFNQPNCGSCKYMEPMVADLERAHPHVKVIRLDIRKAPEVKKNYGVTGTPTFVLLQDGRTLRENRGPFRRKEDFVSFVRPSG